MSEKQVRRGRKARTQHGRTPDPRTRKQDVAACSSTGFVDSASREENKGSSVMDQACGFNHTTVWGNDAPGCAAVAGTVCIC